MGGEAMAQSTLHKGMRWLKTDGVELVGCNVLASSASGQES